MLTLTDKTFTEACRLLALRVHDAGFRPDIIIGIATGGDFVAAQIAANLGLPPEKVLSVRLQRPSTPLKNRFAAIIRRLPRPVADLLRRLEHLRRQNSRPKPIPAPTLPADVLDALSRPDVRNILIADDAIDSGATILAVRQAVATATPAAAIRTAVITLTQKNALLKPDFNLHTSLIRFPWSLDA